jgi:hypothetical protein
VYMISSDVAFLNLANSIFDVPQWHAFLGMLFRVYALKLITR